MSTSVYPKAITSLATSLRRLPGIGKRTAERLALALLEWPDEDLRRFGEDIGKLRDDVFFCRICGNLADSEVCGICSSPTRDRSRVCVVEQPTQIPVIEASRCYTGLYHVLGGRIVPLEGKGPGELRIAELRGRVEAGGIDELILATSSDVEGEATANYIAMEFSHFPLRVSRIAAGVPVGADLSFADAATIAMAMSGRRSLGPGADT